MINYDKKIVFEETDVKPYMPNRRSINPEKDKLIEKKYVTLFDENGKEYSTHLIESYIIQQGHFIGRKYHIFNYVSGKIVMNFNPYDYYNLSEFIDITFEYTIFQMYEGRDYPLIISPDYRLLIK